MKLHLREIFFLFFRRSWVVKMRTKSGVFPGTNAVKNVSGQKFAMGEENGKTAKKGGKYFLRNENFHPRSRRVSRQIYVKFSVAHSFDDWKTPYPPF